MLTDYFEHILQLPLSFHGGTHSGRLMKVMLTGVDALWGLWLSFFREHFAAFVALFVLLPLSLFINWRLASLLVALCVVFSALTALVINRTEKLQSKVEGHFTTLAARIGRPTGVPAEYDVSIYRHQLPGGMTSTLRRQLREIRMEDRWAEVLDELPRVREELGWPIMVTPLSQFLGVQAVLNVTTGVRWSQIRR